MESYNKYFNDAWELLKEYHPMIDLQGETLDLSVKPCITKKQYCHYMNAVFQLLTIGTREGFITPHVDGHGCVVFIKYTGK